MNSSRISASIVEKLCIYTCKLDSDGCTNYTVKKVYHCFVSWLDHTAYSVLAGLFCYEFSLRVIVTLHFSGDMVICNLRRYIIFLVEDSIGGLFSVLSARGSSLLPSDTQVNFLLASCEFGIGSLMLYNHWARSHPCTTRQNIFLRSQHPPTQKNMRGGRWRSVE